jgi:hypothetical protein
VESSCQRGNEPFGFHKMLGNSRVVLSSTELVGVSDENEFTFLLESRQMNGFVVLLLDLEMG